MWICHFGIKNNKKWTTEHNCWNPTECASDGPIEKHIKSQMPRLGYWPLTTKNPSHQLWLIIDQAVTQACRSLMCPPLILLFFRGKSFFTQVHCYIILTHHTPSSFHFCAQCEPSLLVPCNFPNPPTHKYSTETAPLPHAVFSYTTSEIPTNQCQVDMPLAIM